MTSTAASQDSAFPLIVVDATHPHKALRECVEQSLDRYFALLDGQPTANLYELVLQEVEAPLLAAVMRYAGDNQSAASHMLGLSRGTLRKKLKQYELL